MHTVELLDEALDAARAAGIAVREDWFGGAGGVCELRGRICVFLDPTQSPAERLTLIIDALQLATPLNPLFLSVGLRTWVAQRKSA